MAAAPPTAAFTAREAAIRASLLLKDLRSSDPARAEHAARRLGRVPAFARLSPAQLLAARDQVQRKHALAAVAREHGFESWTALKDSLETAPERRFAPEVFFTRKVSAFLNRWFASYPEASASRASAGGYLFPFRHQFFVCEAGFLRSLGIDVTDPDWERIGFDWCSARDAAAQERLENKLVALGFGR